MKPIKPGTRFAVRVGDQWEARNSERGNLTAIKAERWTGDRCDAYDLASDHMPAHKKERDVAVVRILPRTDHKAEAERLRAAIRDALNCARERAEFRLIDVLTKALRDPGEPGKGSRT